MKVLIVGEGGREHTLAWALKKSSAVHTIFAAPGNAGISEIATCVPINAEDAESLAMFAVEQNIDLAVVGPDGALAAGVVDQMQAHGIKAFGPTQKAAKIESSKAFAKQLMKEEGIPTASFEVFTDINAAQSYIKQHGAPIVVKADGLAAGKGVLVCHTVDEALKAASDILSGASFGTAGSRIVVETYLEGEEASVFVFSDGEVVRAMIPSQDHKQIFEGDKGPNTGGMGAYAPAPLVDSQQLQEIVTTIAEPTIRAMATRGATYMGILYIGLIFTEDGPKVIEYNSRFGDPETQVILPLLKNDLIDVMLATCDGRLSSVDLSWHQKAATCVVLASEGYPGSSYKKGEIIHGLEHFSGLDDVILFHANTTMREGELVTNGGRVIGITAIASDLPSSIKRAYEMVDLITYEGKYYRRDIGQKGLGSS